MTLPVDKERVKSAYMCAQVVIDKESDIRLIWGAACVKTPILANIYETQCLLNIASLMRYLVNIIV